MGLLFLLGLVVICSVTFTAVKNGGVPQIMIGSLILILLGFLSPNNIGVFLLFSIVCTAGLGLIPFFLVAWVIGALVMAIVDLIRGKKPQVAGSKKSSGALSVPMQQDQAAIRKYVAESKAAGMPESEIKLRLKSNGWSDAQIKAAT